LLAPPALLLALALAGCETLTKDAAPPPAPARPAGKDVQVAPPPATVETPKPAPAVEPGVLRPAQWQDLPGWQRDDPAAAWSAFRTSCRALAKQELWRDICTVAEALPQPDRDTARRFFEANLAPFQVVNAEGSAEGLVTGYYEPLLRGSRRPDARYRYPVFGVPDDLLVLDLAELYPELKGLRLRGRLDGRRVVPY